MERKELIRFGKRLAWVGGFIAAGILIISAIEQKEASPVKGVFVNVEPLDEEDLLITEEDILLTLERSFGFRMEGVPIANLNVARMEQVLEKDPFILDANVFVDAKNYVNITIEQREPIIRVIDKNGLDYYMDKDGFRMPLSKHFTARVMVATGNLPPHTPEFLDKESDMLKNVFELTHKLLDNSFFTAQIEQIYVSNKREVILIPKLGDQKIILGPYEDIDEKLEKLLVFYKRVVTNEGWSKYKTINLRFKDQLVCEKR